MTSWGGLLKDIAFLSTPSARRATGIIGTIVSIILNFYPRPPRGGRHKNFTHIDVREKISIHALREEGDRTVSPGPFPPWYFYPRPPRGGRRKPLPGLVGKSAFLSTPSARRATDYFGLPTKVKSISIHALREEGDPPNHGRIYTVIVFLSTPSARRAMRGGFAA